MTTEKLKLQKKATALNAIRKIYSPHNYNNGEGLRSNAWDESWAEQRDEQVKNIIDQLEKELFELKQKM
jgi:hypothetical protein